VLRIAAAVHLELALMVEAGPSPMLAITKAAPVRAGDQR
jgi:hypothetical protein